MSIVHYCTNDDVITLFGENISDTLDNDDVIDIAIENATGRIHARLRANNIPLPDPLNISSSIKTVAIYFAICDLYGVLYSGSEYEERKNFWCVTGSELLDDYIEAYKNSCEPDTYSSVNHRNALTYKESVQYGHRNRRYY